MVGREEQRPHWGLDSQRRLGNRNVSISAALGSLLARTLRVLAPLVLQIENTQPNGWAFSMVGREGLEPPTSSV